jgi:serine/threonine-protein phosphatase 6 regulatory ankyrin repeat subunit B
MVKYSDKYFYIKFSVVFLFFLLSMLHFAHEIRANEIGASQLFNLASAGDKDAIANFVKEGGNLNIQDDRGRTALHLALRNKNSKLIGAKLLLANGIDPEIEDLRGRTALHYAAHRGQSVIVDLLIKAQVNIDHKDTNAVTPLMLAGQKGHLETAKKLVNSGASVQAQDGDGWSVLLYSTDGGLNLVQYLIEQGADVKATDNIGWNVLIHSANYNYKDVVDLIIEKGENVNSQGNDGMTALMAASQKGYLNTVQLLLNKGANRDLKDTTGETALDKARNKGHEDVVELLMKRDSKVTS